MNAKVPTTGAPRLLDRLEVDDAIDPAFAVSTDLTAGEHATGGGSSYGVFNWRAALDRADGNRDLLGNMVGLFAAQWRKRLAEIVSGAGHRDIGVLEIVANQLKQSLGSFGAVKACRIVQEMEELVRIRGFDELKLKCDCLLIEIERLVRALKEFSRETRTTDR
jgi:HPt (histidine-containing phosphotransfer) domain-containing protein